MTRSRKLNLCVPEGFALEGCGLRKELAHRYAACVSYTMSGIANRRPDGMMAWPQKSRRNLLGKQDARIIDLAVQTGIVEADYTARDGQCFAFGITPEWAGRPVERMPLESRVLHDAVKRSREYHRARMLPVHLHLLDQACRLDFDLPTALSLIADPANRRTYYKDGRKRGLPMPQHEQDRWLQVRAAQAYSLADREISATVDCWGRMHHGYTSLPKFLRPCISHWGRHLAAVDVVNSQMTLLATLMHFDIMTGDSITEMLKTCRSIEKAVKLLPRTYVRGYDRKLSLAAKPCVPVMFEPSTHEFFEAAAAGEVYEVLARKLGLGDDRDAAKPAVFATLYDNSMLYGAKEAFAEAYPQVWEWIKQVKAAIKTEDYRGNWVDEHRSVCLLLQKFESWLVLENACETLRMAHTTLPVLPIHDSLMCPHDGVEIIESAMGSTMNKWGVPAKFTITEYRPAASARPAPIPEPDIYNANAWWDAEVPVVAA